jgi:hypothetical protein
MLLTEVCPYERDIIRLSKAVLDNSTPKVAKVSTGAELWYTGEQDIYREGTLI